MSVWFHRVILTKSVCHEIISSSNATCKGSDMLYGKNMTSGVKEEREYANSMVVKDTVGISPYYYQVDALGSVREATGGIGTILFASNYEPYGPMYGTSGSDLLKYTGRTLDGIIGGLYYFDARYYDASTGRFITEDTYMGQQTDPLSQNRYIYASDNPEKYIDPTGHRYIVASGGGGYASVPPPPSSQQLPPATHGAAPPPTPPLPSSSETSSSTTGTSTTTVSSTTITTTQTSTQTTMVTHTSGSSSVTTTTSHSSTNPNPTIQAPIPGTTINEDLSITFVVGVSFVTGLAIGFSGGLIVGTPVGAGLIYGDFEAAAEVAADGKSANMGKTDQAFATGFVEGLAYWWDFAGPF